MKREEVERLQADAAALLRKASISFTEHERMSMEVADFGLNDIRNIGLEIIVYENNERYCAKELILLPRQMCPQHRHPKVDELNAGKRETFRCRWGEVYLYLEGSATLSPKAHVPDRYKKHLSVWHEMVLHPGDQCAIAPNTLHWFQAGDHGAIVSEFSSTSVDELDVFTDPNVKRIPEIT
ncbi:MAG: D-lyxose/D-mannose family sugar isomerase [Ignavibacteriales bacterium]|nr:D-lyxose/D-mannose family sugar isomerase [Ignavibacteriales bacterium]